MEIYKKLTELLKDKIELVLIHVIKNEGHSPASSNSKMILTSSGAKFGTVGGGNLEYMAIKKAETVLKNKESVKEVYDLNVNDEENRKSTKKTGMICGGLCEVFFEYIPPLEKLYIFGAGHIGKLVHYHLAKLGFDLEIYDSRFEMLAQVKQYKAKNPVSYSNIPELEEDSYIVIVTHSHKHDLEILEQLFSSKKNYNYIGVIASQSKSEEILEILKQKYPQSPLFKNLYTPIGLNTGGKLPEDIAVSIISEIQVVKNKITNIKHMRER